VSPAKTHWVRSRLSIEARKRGGVTVRDAISRAESNIDEKRGEFLAALDQILAELQAGYGAGATDPTPGDHERLYRLSASIIDLSLCLRDSGIDRAAKALCGLCDLMSRRGQWHQPCIELHVQVLNLLRRSGAQMTNVELSKVLGGLRTVTQKYYGEIN
jgi:hypothetical protein